MGKNDKRYLIISIPFQHICCVCKSKQEVERVLKLNAANKSNHPNYVSNEEMLVVETYAGIMHESF